MQFKHRCNSFSKILYNLRSIEFMNKLGKNMLSSLYGKSLQNAEQFKIKSVPKSEINEFIAENGRDELTLYLMRDKATAYLQELADKASLSSAPADTNEVVSGDEVTEITDVDNSENTNAEEAVEPTEAAQ